MPREESQDRNPKALKRASWSKHADQTEKEEKDKHKHDRLHVDAFKVASLRLAASQAARNANEGRRSSTSSAITIAAETNATLPSDVKSIAASSLRDAVREGWAGESPKKRGRTSVVPAVLVNVAHTHMSVTQQTHTLKPKRPTTCPS